MLIDEQDTECYCGVRYFQLPQFIEPYRVRSAIPPPNEKASCAEYSDPGFCCITSAELPPKSSGSPFGLAVVTNIKQFGGLSMSLTPVAYSGDTECYKNFVSHSPLTLKLMVSLFSVVTAMMAELVVLGSVNLKPRRLSALRKWTVHGVS